MKEKQYEVTFSVTFFIDAENEEEAKDTASEVFGWDMNEYEWDIAVKETPVEKG